VETATVILALSAEFYDNQVLPQTHIRTETAGAGAGATATAAAAGARSTAATAVAPTTAPDRVAEESASSTIATTVSLEKSGLRQSVQHTTKSVALDLDASGAVQAWCGFAELKLHQYTDAMHSLTGVLTKLSNTRTPRSCPVRSQRDNDEHPDRVAFRPLNHSGGDDLGGDGFAAAAAAAVADAGNVQKWIRISQALVECRRQLGLTSTGDFHKFPRTHHLWDAGGSAVTRDDLLIDDVEFFVGSGRTIIAEEKVDGANLGISISTDYQVMYQNRSHFVNMASHPQFASLPEWEDEFRSTLVGVLEPERHVLFGEWCSTVHSLEYTTLPGRFIAFDLYDRFTKTFSTRVELHTLLKYGARLSTEYSTGVCYWHSQSCCGGSPAMRVMA
jgi:hypothetical protein